MIPKSLKKKIGSDKDILDVILYGSHPKGKSKPRDIDVMVVFLRGRLEDRLNKIQEIKEEWNDDKLDIKQSLVTDFLSPEFFARTGILLEGVSLLDNKRISAKLGFKGYSVFSYDLKNLDHNDKIRFGYVLAGRNSRGILKKLNAVKLGKGAVKIPIENSLEFEEVLNMHNIRYKKSDVLEAAG